MASIEERVESLIESTVNNLGYELYDVEYAKEGKDYFLRIFIDKESGIDLNDCEKVNDAINELLDKADYIKEQYFLEVSSPGIERNLRKPEHFERYIENEVEVSLFKAYEKQKVLQGVLKAGDNNKVTISIDNNEITLNRKDISKVKLIYNFGGWLKNELRVY